MAPTTKKAVDYLIRIRDYLEEHSDMMSMLGELNESAKNKGADPNAFRILIGTVLSVRNLDESTVIALRRLFDEAGLNTPTKIAEADPEEVQILIRKSGMYKTKTKRIQDLSKMLLEDYNGIVPKNIDDLLALPGVGRKVANCVLVYAFDIPAIPVDIHVHRISNRTGIVKTKKPEQTEQELLKIYPKQYWTVVNDSLVIFGKNICRPIGPKCNICPITDSCPKIIIKKKPKSKKSSKKKSSKKKSSKKKTSKKKTSKKKIS